jgi:hypothetical protein
VCVGEVLTQCVLGGGGGGGLKGGAEVTEMLVGGWVCLCCELRAVLVVAEK